MRIELLRKIMALAADQRGDLATRQRAQEKLESYRVQYPHLFVVTPTRKPPPDPRVHGMRTDPAYEYYVFTDLSLWDQTKSGNRVHSIYHKGVTYKIVLFQHKKTPAWGWMRTSDYDGTVFSRRFATLGEAHSDSWANLMAL
jgi:hypothetical protein